MTTKSDWAHVDWIQHRHKNENKNRRIDNFNLGSLFSEGRSYAFSDAQKIKWK